MPIRHLMSTQESEVNDVLRQIMLGNGITLAEDAALEVDTGRGRVEWTLVVWEVDDALACGKLHPATESALACVSRWEAPYPPWAL